MRRGTRPKESKIQQIPKRVAGKLVLGSGQHQTQTGRWETWFEFRCDGQLCGNALFRTARAVVTKAMTGTALLRCPACQREAKRQSNAKGKEYSPKPKAEQAPKKTWHKIETRLARSTEPTIGVVGKKAWKRLAAQPERKERVCKIVAEHVRAAKAAKTHIDLDRLLVEAEELVILEEKNGPANDRWTRKNRAEGLQIMRFEQYTSPVGAF